MSRRAATLAVGLAVVAALAAPVHAMPLRADLFRIAPAASLDTGSRARRTAPVEVVAAGDIACDPANSLFDHGHGSGQWCRAAAVAKLIRSIDPTAVLALGDEQYDAGKLRAFRMSYDRSWGNQRARTYAVPGNHEYLASRAAKGYFAYFGEHAGRSHTGWYTERLGDWRLIALNSNCWIAGCTGGTAQYAWLHRVLVRQPTECTVAIMHHPLLSSGPHGDDEARARPLWKLLYRHGVDLALVGHDHDYERFAPVNALGIKDRQHGIREFVVGTGGAEHYPITKVHRFSQVHNTTAYGVLRLMLRSGGYDWRFRPAAGATFTDAGTGQCHGAP
jgi:3',5'-cyclic AMP phosphodiesterase CpdA